MQRFLFFLSTRSYGVQRLCDGFIIPCTLAGWSGKCWGSSGRLSSPDKKCKLVSRRPACRQAFTSSTLLVFVILLLQFTTLAPFHLNGCCLPHTPGGCWSSPPRARASEPLLPPFTLTQQAALYAFLTGFLHLPRRSLGLKMVRLKRTLVLLSFSYCIAAYVNKATKICIGWCSQKPGKKAARNLFLGCALIMDAFSVWLPSSWGRRRLDTAEMEQKSGEMDWGGVEGLQISL